MYPDWPRSDADLVPLPKCDGPKLKPFNFQGPQKIEFLEYLGEGTHAHVVKVKILGQIYALKLFRFPFEENWLSPTGERVWEDHEIMSAFYDYSEPFSCECRAYGRLQEAGYEELAVRCYGYLLLDEEHERALRTRFSDMRLEFDGNMDCCGGDEQRTLFLGRDGRAPPIRGIVKEFGLGLGDEENLRPALARKVLRDVVKLQQLGIIHIDVGCRQIINDKLVDFSTAMTTPHFLMTPELNPRLTPEMISAMEYETFKVSVSDYLEFDDMMSDWNREHAAQRGRISVNAFPGGRGCGMKHNLRSKAARERVYTFVDPRKYDWRRTYPVSVGASGGKVTKTPPQLHARPPMWYYDCGGLLGAGGWISVVAERLGGPHAQDPMLDWMYKDGLIFPRLDDRWFLRF